MKENHFNNHWHMTLLTMGLHILLSLLFSLCLFSHIAEAQVIDVYSSEEIYTIEDVAAVLVDETSKMTFDEVKESTFMPSTKIDSLLSDMEMGKPVWLKFSIVNHTDGPLCLFQDFTLYSGLTLFTAVDTGFIVQSINDNTVFSERENPHPIGYFNIHQSVSDTIHCFVKVWSYGVMRPRISITSDESLFSYLEFRDITAAMLIGLFVVMFFFNIFILFISRDLSYVPYIFYVLSVGLTLTAESGYAHQIFWPNSIFLIQNGFIFFSSLSVISALLFTYVFLNLSSSKQFKINHYILLCFIALPFVVTLLIGRVAAFNMLTIIMPVGSLYVLYVIVYKWLRGYRPARILLIGWSFLLISANVNLVLKLGLIEPTLFLDHVVILGFAMELLLLSYAITDRIHYFRELAEASQKKLEEILRNQNIDLEQLVQNRTNRLNEVLMEQENIIRKRTDNLIQVNEKLFVKNQQLLLFSKIATNNLESPINNLVGVTNFIKKGENTNDNIKLWVKTILESSQRLDYITQLLNYSVDFENHYDKEKSDINLKELVNMIANEKNINYQLDVLHTELMLSLNKSVFKILLELLILKLKTRMNKFSNLTNQIIVDSNNPNLVIKSLTNEDLFDANKLSTIHAMSNSTTFELEFFVMDLIAQYLEINVSFYYESDLSLYIKLDF